MKFLSGKFLFKGNSLNLENFRLYSSNYMKFKHPSSEISDFYSVGDATHYSLWILHSI